MTIHELTDEQIDAMEGGGEMSLLVAEAIDHPVTLREDGVCWHYSKIDNKGYRFEPWFDWRQAMFAAEKFGPLIGKFPDQPWRCHIHDYSTETNRSFTAHGTTGPLAICRAILKLAREK